jgi:hypothetical protein
MNNLKRLTVWTVGSAKNYENDPENQWPEHLWQKKWDWEPLASNQIGFVQTKNIDMDVLEGIKNGDYIDLTSGSKAHSSALIQVVKEQGIDVNFVLQTRSGETLNLTSGELSVNSNDLTLMEHIWLSSGYITDFGAKGDSKKGEIWINSKKETKYKIQPKYPAKISSALGLRKEIKLDKGFWLEKASAHIISTWPRISEVFVGVRLIRPSFSRVAGVAQCTIVSGMRSTPWRQNLFDEQFMSHWQDDDELSNAENSEAWRVFLRKWTDYLRGGSLSREANKAIIESIHSIEFDFIAKDNTNMTVITGECKHKNKVSGGEIGRIFSLSKMVFPINGSPLMIYSGETNEIIDGVHKISWPDLQDQDILKNTTTGIFSKSTQDEKKTIVQEEKKSNLKYDKEKIEIIKESLFLIKTDPRSYSPQFVDLLKQRGFVNTRGLLLWIEKHLSVEMGFKINRDVLGTPEWISWRDTGETEIKGKSSSNNNDIKKLLEKIVELLENGK